ncbi:MAG: hypothetical protein ABEI39_02625 [Halobacteriales archaeon]
MTVPVRYHCPRCGAIATLERDAYLEDRSVTATPREGWGYAAPHEPFEDADGVEIVCGADETDGEGCGRRYYLNFIRFEGGERIDRGASIDARFDFSP